MNEEQFKITKLYFDLNNPTTYVESIKITPKLIGKERTPDETYQEYLKMHEETMGISFPPAKTQKGK